MKIKVGCAVDLIRCSQENIIEILDGLTPEEIEEEVKEAAFEHFDWWYVMMGEESGEDEIYGNL